MDNIENDGTLFFFYIIRLNPVELGEGFKAT
jgi:hypothetical protein